MLLKTLQDDAVVELLSRGEVYRCCPKKSELLWDGQWDPMFLPAYQWMADRLEEVDPERPCEFPVWGWHSIPTEDLFTTAREHGLTILTVDIPEEKVLLSDITAFDSVINNVPHLTQVQERSWFSAHGWDWRTATDDQWEKFYAWTDSMEAEKESTWEQIPGSRGMFTQAVFWELRPDQVVTSAKPNFS